MTACLFVIRGNNQQSEYRALTFGVEAFPTLTPLICTQAAPGTHGPVLPQGWGGRWGAAAVLRAGIDKK